MTSKDYKENFKKFPERAWLSDSIRSIGTNVDIIELAQYLSGEKDITTIDDPGKLYKIRFTVSRLHMYASKCLELIEDMELDGFDEFEDKKIGIEELGISENDVFECTESFNLLDMMDIEAGTKIQVFDFQNAGENSQFACRYINWIRNKNMERLFPNGYNSMFLIPIKHLERYFKKIGA